ncbi:MAG TPA: isoprenylcysteine carboxylmethyltransferase family protein [Gammaproteobacteria bacterium]|nr:isoprenylcysteine carboxylmethyltransferase family protein [Gammaproteobacteria bacterium]
MSHRTQDLPPQTGLAHALRELRYHEASRQVLAVVLIVLYTVTARPTLALAAVGVALALLGTVVRLYASGFIIKNEALATHGPYAHVRHPLYTGNILLVVGFAIANSRWWAVPLAAFLFWFYYPCAIEYEDRKLRRIFGAAWEQWASRTPALIPKLGGSPASTSGSWSLATSMRQNGELILVAFGVACMAWVVWRTL